MKIKNNMHEKPTLSSPEFKLITFKKKIIRHPVYPCQRASKC